MKAKINAALLHFFLSILLVGLSTGFMLWHFYPSVFLDIEKPYDALKIIVPADIILGPLLTFIIYKKGKWGLTFDLIVIVLCQLLALGYGCHAMYSARPGFLVFHGDTFFIVPPKIDQTALSGTQLEVGLLGSPKIVYLFLPGNSSQRFKLAMDSTYEGIPIHWQAKYFKDFSETGTENLNKASIAIQTLKKASNEKQSVLLEQLTLSGKKLAFIPAVGTHTETIIAIDLKTKTPFQTVDISPY